jgi:DNA-binding winged helix-turn-helix (wHTH) protein/WD40 repeat protein
MGDAGYHKPPEVIRFAAFQLRSDTRELYKQGTRIRLQIKPFQVLETLLERPGELVTREELRNRLWPSGTFVDFESGLNTAINRLRAALGDSAEEPRYIETLPRLGYRFICPVQVIPRDGAPEPLSLLTPAPAVAETLPPAPVAAFADPGKKPRRMSAWIAAGCLLVAAVLVSFFHEKSGFQPSADFRPVSFRGAGLISARFLSGSRVVYSANLDDKRQTFVSGLDGSNNYSLPLSGVVTAVSDSGDLAVITGEHGKGGPLCLERTSLRDGKKTVIAEDITGADWTADGKQIAAVRVSGTEMLVEFPLGKVIYRSDGWINGLRVSPDGNQVAFLEHPVHEDDAGHVRIVSQTGQTRVLTPEWGSAEGLAWGPAGQVWFTASQSGVSRSLYSVSVSGRVRKLSHQPLSLRLLDVSSSGRALLAVDDHRMTLRTAIYGKEADISQFDFSHVDDIAHDGNVLLFTESGDAGGLHYAAYVYDLNAHAARRFGSGRALSLSPDAKQAITVDPQDWTTLTITCLTSGRATRVPSDGFRYQWARFFRDGELLVGGSYQGQPLETAFQDIKTGKIEPITGVPYLDSAALSPDGTKLAGRSNAETVIFDLTTKNMERVPSHSEPIVWSDDGHSLFLLTSNPAPYSIVAYNLSTKQFTAWKTIVPQNAAAFAGLAGVAAAPDCGAYAYSAHLKLSRLYLVDGIT